MGAIVTLSAGDGTAIKFVKGFSGTNNTDGTYTVSVGTQNVKITAANVFHSVTVPDGFERDDAAVDEVYRYQIGTTTYYAGGTQRTLKLNDGYVANGSVAIGGDTLIANEDGTCSFTAGSVTTITGNLGEGSKYGLSI